MQKFEEMGVQIRRFSVHIIIAKRHFANCLLE